jgi:hypothetical protein
MNRVAGSTITWDYEPCDSENGPMGFFDTMEGEILIVGHDKKTFWVACNDGTRQLVRESQILSEAEVEKRIREFESWYEKERK